LSKLLAPSYPDNPVMERPLINKTNSKKKLVDLPKRKPVQKTLVIPRTKIEISLTNIQRDSFKKPFKLTMTFNQIKIETLNQSNQAQH
jgi:hypothetical protein